jgi:hypothetical protein
VISAVVFVASAGYWAYVAVGWLTGPPFAHQLLAVLSGFFCSAFLVFSASREWNASRRRSSR